MPRRHIFFYFFIFVELPIEYTDDILANLPQAGQPNDARSPLLHYTPGLHLIIWVDGLAAENILLISSGQRFAKPNQMERPTKQLELKPNLVKLSIISKFRHTKLSCSRSHFSVKKLANLFPTNIDSNVLEKFFFDIFCQRGLLFCNIHFQIIEI